MAAPACSERTSSSAAFPGLARAPCCGRRWGLAAPIRARPGDGVRRSTRKGGMKPRVGRPRLARFACESPSNRGVAREDVAVVDWRCATSRADAAAHPHAGDTLGLGLGLGLVDVLLRNRGTAATFAPARPRPRRARHTRGHSMILTRHSGATRADVKLRCQTGSGSGAQRRWACAAPTRTSASIDAGEAPGQSIGRLVRVWAQRPPVQRPAGEISWSMSSAEAPGSTTGRYAISRGQATERPVDKECRPDQGLGDRQ